MTADGTHVALARNFALLRLLALGFEDDDPPDRTLPNDVGYFLDANVVLFFADPVSDAFLIKIFGGHAAFEFPEAAELARSELKLLPAFAKNEGDRLKEIIGRRPTHVLRPHRLEIDWKQARLRTEVISNLASLDDEDRERERDYINTIERELQRASEELQRAPENKKIDTKLFFDIFLANYVPAMVHKVSTLSRMKAMVSAGLLREQHINAWEQKSRANNDLWSFIYERLMSVKPKSTRDVHFTVMQDAEALALVCQNVTSTGKKSAFLTFDWTIHRAFNDIYHSIDSVPSKVRSQLPNKNFIRHPIIYTALVSEPDAQGAPGHLRGFIRDIDMLFHRLIGNKDCYQRTLGEIAFHGKFDRIRYLLEEGTTEFQRGLQPFVERLSKDILFVHEESAVNAVTALLGSVDAARENRSSTEGLGKGELQSVLELVSDQIETRSAEKAAALVKTFAAIPIVDADVVEGEPLLVDEARLILSEWSLTRRDNEASPAGRTRQLLRNWPGWIRISPDQVKLLNDIVGNSEAFTNSLLNLPNSIDEEFYLLGALIAAIKNDWVLSERYAIIARSMAENRDNTARLAEAEYWIGVSRHYQIDPGLNHLMKADRRLQRAAQLSNGAIDHLRFETERLWISTLLPYHRYMYGDDRYPAGDDATGTRSAESVMKSLSAVERRFVKTAYVPYDAISLRLGIHIYSCLCLLALFSWGLPPQYGREQPQSKQVIRRYLDALRRLCTQQRVTVSLRVQFIMHACDFELSGNPEALVSIAKLKTMSSDVLIPFDHKMISDFLALASVKRVRR